MSLGRRLVDLARANLNALLDRVNENSIDELSDVELEAELELRRERRKREAVERHQRIAAEAAARRRASERRPSGGAAGNSRRSFSAGAVVSNERTRQLYAQLEVENGASFEEVKQSFRRLMRKYHPDLHVGNPTKHRAATELTMSLTQAYTELERLLSR